MTDIKKVLCKHCNVFYLATKDNFYTCRGKLILAKCKECKKEASKKYEKNRPPRNRVSYNRAYYLKRKELKSMDKKNILLV
jgi:RNase P subunit RPR2